MIKYAVYAIYKGRECALAADGSLQPIVYYNGAPNFDALDVLLWRDGQTFASVGAVPPMIYEHKWCIYSVHRFWRVGGMWATFEKIHPKCILFDKVMARTQVTL